MATYTLGSSRHAIEVGAGATVVFLSAFDLGGVQSGPNHLFELRNPNGTLIVGSAQLGYRYTSQSGFLVRLALTPLYAHGKGVLWGGLSFGRAF